MMILIYRKNAVLRTAGMAAQHLPLPSIRGLLTGAASLYYQ